MTPGETRQRFVETLDAVLLSFRRQLDDEDPTAAVPVISGLKATSLGIIPTRYDRGAIFGFDICRLNDLVAYDAGGMAFIDQWTLPDGMFPRDWVVSQGTLYDGDKLVNIWGSNYTPYVHRITLPTTLRGANFYLMGAVLYNCTTNIFTTRLLGGNNPPITVEKDNVTLAEIQRAALRDDPLDTNFKVQPTTDEIIIGRFLADVELAVEDQITFTLYMMNEKRRYPLPSGLPCETYAQMAVLIDSAINMVDQASFDTTTVYDLMLEICDAGTWGASFYDYWTTPGRSLPTNVKYYYNRLFGGYQPGPIP